MKKALRFTFLLIGVAFCTLLVSATSDPESTVKHEAGIATQETMETAAELVTPFYSQEFTELLNKHMDAMSEIYETFNNNTLKIDYLEGEEETGEQINFIWQDVKYRKEFYWVGFTEVFGFDGRQQWHGSDYTLPRLLDAGRPADISAQLIGYFAYLRPQYQKYLEPADTDIPLKLDERYTVISFTPPLMSEALILIDPLDFRLAGMLLGNNHRLQESMIYTLTTYENWQDFEAAYYPQTIRIERRSPENMELRERLITTKSISRIDPIDRDQFAVTSTSPPTQPELPVVPYEVPFSFLNNKVVVRCKGPKGDRLRLELDTGANVGLLRDDVAEDLGFELKNKGEITGHGGSARVQYVRAEGIVLEGSNRDYSVELPAWPAAVLIEDDSLNEVLASKGVDGLLGNFILHNFVVKIDFRRKKLYLFPPERFNPDEHLGDDYHAVPVVRDTMPYIQITVDDKIHGGAYFNTGAQHFFALNAWAIDDAGLLYEVESVGSGITVHGLTAFGIIQPKKLAIGDIVIEEPRTHLEILAPGESPNRNQIASFGTGFFHRNTITFDLFNEMYYIEGI